MADTKKGKVIRISDKAYRRLTKLQEKRTAKLDKHVGLADVVDYVLDKALKKKD